MITVSDYLGPYDNHPEVTPGLIDDVNVLLEKVNEVLSRAQLDGVGMWINPFTKSYVSGQGNGGFRPSSSPIGAPNSNHKHGKAVDVYDPEEELEAWCRSHARDLEEVGVWLEDGRYTRGWVHMQSVPPKSGRRFFIP